MEAMTRLEIWEDRTRGPLMWLALLFLLAYAIPIVAPDSPDALRRTSDTFQYTIWLVFAADYLWRLSLAERRWHFVTHNLVDLAAVVMPALRPLRLVSALAMVHRQAGKRLRGHVAAYVATSTALIITISGLAVLDAERASPEANIETWQDSLWWAVVTVTTVGYGDFYPVTTEGRLFALGLMLCGLGLLGIVTANLSSWLLERVSNSEEQSQVATHADMAALMQSIQELREEISQLRRPAP